MEFPDTIEGFGYTFNEEGKLRNINTDEPYQFHVKDNDQSYNQKRYEALGELITPTVYALLEEKCGLKRFSVPLNPAENEPRTYIFCTENFESADKLLILIHGSGVVRAGQWARRLIINDCLNSGTQIPFINRAKEEDYGVLVMNTNDNVEIRDGKKWKIKWLQEVSLLEAGHSQDLLQRLVSLSLCQDLDQGSESPDEHGKYVWKNYIRKCKASKIAIVAHSYGGVVLTELADQFSQEFHHRVFAVALTDSVHCGIPKNSNLLEVGRNWVGSQKPLDTPIKMGYRTDIACVSAGCVEHEMTSWSSFESIFKFFAERLADVEQESLERNSSDKPLETEDPTSKSEKDSLISESHPTKSENKDSLMEEDQPSESEKDSLVLESHPAKSENKDSQMEEDQPSNSEKDSLVQDNVSGSKFESMDSDIADPPLRKDEIPGDSGNLKRKFCLVSPTEDMRPLDCGNQEESDPELD